MNNVESALLTGFVFMSAFALGVKSLYEKFIGLNEKLISNNTKLIDNSIKVTNKLFKAQEIHTSDLFEFKEYVSEKEQEKTEIIAQLYEEIEKVNKSSAGTPVFFMGTPQQVFPRKQYPYIVIHEVYKDALKQIEYIAETEKCWIELIAGTIKTKNYRTVVDIAVFSNEEYLLEFVKLLILQRLQEVSYKAIPEVPMSVKEARKAKCINCHLQAKCITFNEKMNLIDFKCPKEIIKGEK